MTHLLSGLMSWMKHGNSKHCEELLTWAKNEYKKDWQFAYQYMIDHNGRAPNYRDLNGTRLRKEVA